MTTTVLTDENRRTVARAIWSIRREEEDRCDMELEDMPPSHSVWAEADAAIGAIEQAVLQSPEVQARMEAYAAAKVREAQQWQPIETAPKDGTVVMVCNEDGTWIAKYVPIYPSGCRAENPWFSLMLNHDHLRKVRSYRPTHWMPLPAPPLPGPVEPTT